MIPFQYHGAKKDALRHLYPAIGSVDVLVECFGGRLDFTLNYPQRDKCRHIVVGDISGGLVNFWRAIKYNPAGLAQLCNNEVQAELELLAKHKQLVLRRLELEDLLKSDEESFDLQMALRFWYCQCLFTDTGGIGRLRNKASLSWSNDSMALRDKTTYFTQLSEQLRGVRILFRDWRETVDAAPNIGTIGILFDPPYDHDLRCADAYEHDCSDVAADAAEYATVLGRQPHIRIAFCGMTNEHAFPFVEGWQARGWKSSKCRAGARECIWFSPNCLYPEQAQKKKRRTLTKREKLAL